MHERPPDLIPAAPAAALLEPESTSPCTLAGISFRVADLEGLLPDFQFADAAA